MQVLQFLVIVTVKIIIVVADLNLSPELPIWVCSSREVEVVQDGVRAVFNGRLDEEEVRRWGAAYKLVQGREFGGVSARGLEWELYWI
jgi:hypothetical protein